MFGLYYAQAPTSCESFRIYIFFNDATTFKWRCLPFNAQFLDSMEVEILNLSLVIYRQNFLNWKTLLLNYLFLLSTWEWFCGKCLNFSFCCYLYIYYATDADLNRKFQGYKNLHCRVIQPKKKKSLRKYSFT